MSIVTHAIMLVVHRTNLCRLRSGHNPSSKTAFQLGARMLCAVTPFPQHYIFHKLCMFYITVIRILDIFFLPTTAVCFVHYIAR